MIFDFAPLQRSIEQVETVVRFGFVTKVRNEAVCVKGLSRHARTGDQVEIQSGTGRILGGEIIAIDTHEAIVMLLSDHVSPAIGDRVALKGDPEFNPTSGWMGSIIDAFGRPLNGELLPSGEHPVSLRRTPPDPTRRRPLGARLNTGMVVLDTFLPIARGQRVGIFAGSGVGKTSLLAKIAQNVEADCVVIGLIGERGRELKEFIDNILGPEGMKRSVVVAATSDQSPILKRRAAWTATAIAEVLRDTGLHVLLIIDSLTRFAEAHREIALTSGETPSLRAYPPSTSNMLASLTERAGPGEPNQGDITAVYSVLVAGSDMEEPVADMVRGLLDGHIVLDRAIAERGRYPAIDVRKSISRSLPSIASDAENATLSDARNVLNAYENAEVLIHTGLYVSGTDPKIDRAIELWPLIENLISTDGMPDASASFKLLSEVLGTTETDSENVEEA